MELTTEAQNKAEKIKRKNNQYVLLDIHSGGCAGFSFDFKIINELKQGHKEISEGFVIDEIFEWMLDNSTVDFEDSPIHSQFKLDISGVKSCGCGISFNLENQFS